MIGSLCLTMAVLLGPSTVSIAAAKGEETPLTAQGEKLLATYAGMLESLKAELVPALSTTAKKP